jgi:hypothetical protein
LEEKTAKKQKKEAPPNFYEDDVRNREAALILLVQRLVKHQNSNERSREEIVRTINQVSKNLEHLSRVIESAANILCPSRTPDL